MMSKYEISTETGNGEIVSMSEQRSARPILLPAVIVGGMTVVAMTVGLLFNASVLWTVLSGGFDAFQSELDVPYFREAFFVMWTIGVACLVTLAVCGIDFLRSNLRWARLATMVFLFEIGYIFAIGSLWMLPDYGMSIAAATGVANTGLMVQFFILLPLWGPLMLWWARRTEQRSLKA